MKRLTAQLSEQFTESARLEQEIKKNLSWLLKRDPMSCVFALNFWRENGKNSWTDCHDG